MVRIRLISFLVILSVSAAFAESPKQQSAGAVSGRIMFSEQSPMLNAMVLIFNQQLGPPPHPYKYWRIPDEIFSAGPDGRFSINLQEGIYYLMIAQKNLDRDVGPPSLDEFVYVHGDKDGNALPLKIESGKTLELGDLSGVYLWKADKVEREKGVTSASGVVEDSAGKPVNGVIIFAYLSRGAKGRPAFVSDRTDKDGKFTIRFFGEGRYFLKVREVIGGGMPRKGELTNVDREFEPVMIELKKDEKLKNVKLQVKMFSRPDKASVLDKNESLK